MAQARQTVVWDDGKGRGLPEKLITIVKLTEKDWRQIEKPGDYGFTDQIGSWGLECLILNCPFCGHETPLPFLISVTSRQPLTIKEELHCGQCLKDFSVIEDTAMLSWGDIYGDYTGTNKEG